MLDLEHHANLLPVARATGRGRPCHDRRDARRARCRARRTAGRARLGDRRVQRDGRGAADRGASPAWRTRAAHASRWMPHSCCRTGGSISRHPTSTTSPSRATRRTRRSASGALVGRADWLDAAQPYLAGGGAVESVRLDHVDWKQGADRHEAGTPNVLGIAALARALVELERLGDEPRREHEAALTARLHSRARRPARRARHPRLRRRRRSPRHRDHRARARLGRPRRRGARGRARHLGARGALLRAPLLRPRRHAGPTGCARASAPGRPPTTSTASSTRSRRSSPTARRTRTSAHPRAGVRASTTGPGPPSTDHVPVGVSRPTPPSGIR